MSDKLNIAEKLLEISERQAKTESLNTHLLLEVKALKKEVQELKGAHSNVRFLGKVIRAIGWFFLVLAGAAVISFEGIGKAIDGIFKH